MYILLVHALIHVHIFKNLYLMKCLYTTAIFNMFKTFFFLPEMQLNTHNKQFHIIAATNKQQ